jgi:hypothetical protein
MGHYGSCYDDFAERDAQLRVLHTARFRAQRAGQKHLVRDLDRQIRRCGG